MSNSRNGLCCLAKYLPLACAGVLLLGSSITATAQTCVQDIFGKNTTCTANDVRIAKASNPRSLDGTPKLTCTAGLPFSFVADFTVVTTATARENIGMYFATGGQGNALKGTCGDNIIAPPHMSANPDDKVTLGTSQYEENSGIDPAGDNCGDISTSDNNQVITVEIDNAMCVAAPGTNQVALPNCTTWQQQGGVQLCQSPGPNYPFVPAAQPGSPSKCNCDNTFTVPITVQTPGVGVAKTCNTTTTGTSSTQCDAGAEGAETVTYSVTVTNSSNVGTVALDQICDSAYGNIATASGFSPACATGAHAADLTGTSSCSLPQTLAAAGSSGDSYTCTFTANVGEAAGSTGITDTITANGVGADGKTPFSNTSNAVKVISEDAPSTAQTTKSAASNQNACFTVRYNVAVKNTSGADETLTLSGLSDSAFGDLTKLSTNSTGVVGTTCGVATGSQGLGTLSGSSGAGAFGTLATSGSSQTYSCVFDAVFCGTPGPISNGSTLICSSGVQHTNTITPALTGDEGEVVTNTGGSATVNECITMTQQ